jgi:hypothetical protein
MIKKIGCIPPLHLHLKLREWVFIALEGPGVRPMSLLVFQIVLEVLANVVRKELRNREARMKIGRKDKKPK